MVVRQYGVRLVLALLAGALLQCTLSDAAGERVAVQAAALIRDEAHEGRSGFLFLPPLVPEAQRTGEFEPGLEPEVRIDKVTEQGTFRSNFATFTATPGRDRNAVLLNRSARYYVLRWRVTGNIQRPERLRVRVLVRGVELGFVEFQLVASRAQYDNFDRSVALPLLRGDTLAFKFWIAKHAVDADGDGVFDGADNCPTVANSATNATSDADSAEPQPVPENCDSNLRACDPNEGPASTPSFEQPDADGDGVGDACDCMTPGQGCEPALSGGSGEHGADAGHESDAGNAGMVAHAGAGHGGGAHGGAGHGAATGGVGGAGGADAPSHAGAGGATHATGPHIDVDAIPAGDRGISMRAIRDTRERPADSDGVGAFRTVCAFSHMNFDDPIVFPGVPNSAHLHAYFGNTATDASSTAESLRTRGNSTCRGGIVNRTAYWVPALIDANGKPLAPGDADIYYKTGYHGVAPRSITAFPAGLRMIAGDARASAPQENAWWGCDDHYIGRSPEIPNCPSGDRIVMTVVFPQCWDGSHLDSADHKSHMAYPEDGRCPSSHPVALPEITFNIPYAISAGARARLRLASDTYAATSPGGYSAHADWFEAWDPAVMATWVSRCDQSALDCHSHLLGDGRELYYPRDLDESVTPAPGSD